MDEGIRARLLCAHDRERAIACLAEDPDANLALIDYVDRLGRALAPGEILPTVQGAFRGEELLGVVLLRPCVAISSGIPQSALDFLMPQLLRVPGGLVKSDREVVDRVWPRLESAGRRASIDRIEIAYRLKPADMLPADPDLPGVARPARMEDLDELVHAARASLWEEDRPDPAEGDLPGFRRWVASRVSRARIVTDAGRIVFVAYADVRRSEGWLIQGVYTWPECRRRGFARRGMDSVIREAFASGAAHVQLAVVEGNERASALYRELGFETFGELRTILFS